MTAVFGAQPGDVATAVTRLARTDSGRVLSLLATRYDDVDLADDCVQEALVQAVESWPVSGIPDNPAAWLYAVARNKLVDRLRRRAVEHRRLAGAARELAVDADRETPAAEEFSRIVDSAGIGDERLRLMLLCCHPALRREAQVALTLRLVGGLTTAEIAAAFLVAEETLAQRIVRAKRKIRAARIPLSIPADLDERVDALLAVLYLVFNEGYLALGAVADRLVRVDLVDEAIRLTEVAVSLVPDNGEARGLLALELFTHARSATRVDGAGDLVSLPEQDRRDWDRALIDRAQAILRDAVALPGVGPYRIQALIAGIHSRAQTADDTDWEAIVGLYRILERITPTPIVALNRAVAVGMSQGATAGLADLDAIVGLEGHHLWHAARAEMLVRLDRPDDARAAFTTAIGCARNPVETRHLRRRLAAIGE